MASAVAQQNPGIYPSGTGFSVIYTVLYAGTDVPDGVVQAEVPVEFGYGDSPVQMGDRVGAAVRAGATRLGLTVGSQAVITTGFTKV